MFRSARTQTVPPLSHFLSALEAYLDEVELLQVTGADPQPNPWVSSDPVPDPSRTGPRFGGGTRQ